MLRFEIETRAGYLYATLSGGFQLDSARDVYRAILEAAAARGEPKILMDCTRITGEAAQALVLGRLPGGPQVAMRMRASDSFAELRSWLGV